MKRFMRSFRYGQKGFTLMELLIVIAILGVLAAVLVPRLGAFLSSGQVAAANTEVANVETAALAYYADNEIFPTVVADFTDFETNYLSDTPVMTGLYGFDQDGKVVITAGVAWPNDSAVTWDATNHKWSK